MATARTCKTPEYETLDLKFLLWLLASNQQEEGNHKGGGNDKYKNRAMARAGFEMVGT